MNYKFHNTNSHNLKSLLCGCALVTMLVTAASAVAATSSVQVQMEAMPLSDAFFRWN